ncbi:MAG TPA: DUF5916 domain-containing protein [Puia sp.]|nr:DUF5916 domain-containing protein [Puia sp.]
MYKITHLLLLFLLTGTLSFSQDVFPPPTVKQLLEARQITGSLKIDGRLDEPEWSLARPIGDFIQTDPSQGMPALRPTVVRLLYNKDYLYISAICYDTIGRKKYRALNFQRDYVAGNADFFALAIDGYNDERNCAMFGMNPYGVQRDLLSFDDNYFDPDWDGLWLVRTQRTDTAWIAEAAIPWKTLRYRRSADSLQTWGISFGRIARTSNEFSNWPAFPRAYGGLRMTYAGKLVNLRAPKPSTNIRVQPYTLYSYAETRESEKSVYRKSTVKPGGDIKWALDPNTLLDLTFNTDFAQADVDRQVNNINRFSVFFPEKRQFFLENAGLFSAGLEPLPNAQSDYSTRIQPFFSRSIGLDPNGNPLPIDAGARLVYRSDKINAGGLFIRQGSKDSTGSANFVVGRYSQNLGKQNRVGVLLSYKGTQAGVNSFTGSVDGFFRWGQRLSWSFMGSSTADRSPGPSSASNSRNDQGYAASSQLLYNSNTWIAWWSQSIVTNKYSPQIGFVARGNTLVTDPGAIIQLRGKWLPAWIRSFNPGISYTTYHNATTLTLTDRYINCNPLSLQLRDGGLISWHVIFTRQRLENDFTPLGVTIGAGDYTYIRHKILLSTDPSKKISAALTGDLGQYYNGSYQSVTATCSFAPVPYFFISPTVQAGRLKNVGVDNTTKNIRLYTIEGRVGLNPRLQLSGILQRSNITNTVSWNTRLSWEFKPLSYCYIVYNNNSGTAAAKTMEQQVIAKISYLKQF